MSISQEAGQTTPLEAAQDDHAHALSVKRGRRLHSQRRKLTQRATELEARATALQMELAFLDGDARAEHTGELEEIALELQRLRHEVPAQLGAEALAHVDGGDVYYPYTADDLIAWADRVEALGFNRPKYGETQLVKLVHLEEVPNAPFRERLEALQAHDEDTLSIVARRVGYVDQSGKADVSHVKRTLGIEGNGSSFTLFIPYDLGVEFMRALQMTPREAGV